jgi:phosphoglycerol transferase MdoB-like AlkP superfamily enzyme
MRRYKLLIWPLALMLAISLLTRLALALRPEAHGDWLGMSGAFLLGSAFDLITAGYLLAPALVLLSLLPDRIASWPVTRTVMLMASAVLAFALLVVAVAEWTFWDEFGGRFNFIAVDYLIYTHEVLGNIWESYPVGKILSGIALAALILTAINARTMWTCMAIPVAAKLRMTVLAIALAIPVTLYVCVNTEQKNIFSSDALNELAGNGIYEFFAAVYSSDLDFMRLYRHIPADEALADSRQLRSITRDGWRSSDPRDFLHQVKDPHPAKRLNVVLISVESLGSEFLGAWGDPRGLTPRLDALAKASLVFSRVYATGNRTVRGLEALSLGLPPTPGQSILKRPHNDQLFSLGSVFEDVGYEPMFIYGGYGYFDNMNGFFSANDYRAIDRLSMPKERIHFENIWGIADEDLFSMAIEQIDAALKTSGGKQPVFAHIMTTSNHRPYTYPEGRIDIRSGSGREGAVKYTDWAIGHFIDEARKKPWFRDTLFVITADHGASARGTSEIPVEKYRIPLIIHAPAHVKSGRIDRVMSQIDIPPTVLGQLHMSYESKFFGQDMLRQPVGLERAFVANYQTLGYLREGRLVTLLPGQKVTIAPHPEAPPAGAKPMSDEALIREAIVWYEAAFLGFKYGYILDEDGDREAEHHPRH